MIKNSCVTTTHKIIDKEIGVVFQDINEETLEIIDDREMAKSLDMVPQGTVIDSFEMLSNSVSLENEFYAKETKHVGYIRPTDYLWQGITNIGYHYWSNYKLTSLNNYEAYLLRR